jgi:malonyl-CoA decarboxylase
MLKSIHDIIGDKKIRVDLKEADTAVFYSLNNTFKSLSGIGLGEKMIIRAKEYIKEHYPHIKQFSTLSPVPGFKEYLDSILMGQKASYFLTKNMLDDTSKKNRFFSQKAIDTIVKEYGSMNSDKEVPFSKILLRVLHLNDWFENPVYKKHMEDPLIKLCKHYLTVEKKKDKETGLALHAVLDPVAHFHLSNGASIGSINYLANTSDKGMKESFGMMVNYIYSDKKHDSNKIKYSQGIVDTHV